jgi:phosphoribosyl-ATP pyrophosphohydrolase
MAKAAKKASPKRSDAKPAKKKARAAGSDTVATGDARSGTVLDRLWEVVDSRREANPSASHSARLLARGKAKVAQKFGEEAVECVIEAAVGNRDALILESADLIYHLMVVWVDAGIRPDEVWAELERRQGISGIAEKSGRALKLSMAFGTRSSKIP